MPIQRETLDLLRSHPGCTVRRLARELNIVDATMYTRLRSLVGGGHAHSRRLGYRAVTWWPGGSGPTPDATEQVLEALRMHPGSTPAEVAELVGVTKQSASKHLRILEGAGDARRTRRAGPWGDLWRAAGDDLPVDETPEPEPADPALLASANRALVGQPEEALCEIDRLRRSVADIVTHARTT